MASSGLIEDKRFKHAVNLFNSKDWYPAHDAFEELWHETAGPERYTLQAFLQISVAQLHLENGNTNGATILLGEALGRLTKMGAPDMGFDIEKICYYLDECLDKLHGELELNGLNPPVLVKKIL